MNEIKGKEKTTQEKLPVLQYNPWHAAFACALMGLLSVGLVSGYWKGALLVGITGAALGYFGTIALNAHYKTTNRRP